MAEDPRAQEALELSRLYDLAEGVAVEVVLPEPNWCQIATQASELADAARARCGHDKN